MPKKRREALPHGFKVGDTVRVKTPGVGAPMCVVQIRGNTITCLAFQRGAEVFIHMRIPSQALKKMGDV